MAEPLMLHPNEWHDAQESDSGFGEAAEFGDGAGHQPLLYADLDETAGERDRFDPDEEALASAAEAIGTATLAGLTLPRGGTGDRLIRLGYRLGIPPRLLTEPFARKSKPRLLATVENPLPGDRIAGTALRAGHFLAQGAMLPLAAIDFAGPGTLAPPFARALHGFHWLADLETGAARETVAPIAERLFSQWHDVHAKPPRRPARTGAWTVGHTGWRLLNWLVHAPLLLSSADRAGRARTFAAFETTARWLERKAKRAPDPLSEAAAWAAVLAAGLLLQGGKPRRLHAESQLMRPLGEMVGEDGAMLSRSPIAQFEAIALLVKLRACYRACRRKPPAALDTMLTMLLPPLLALIHGDGGLGSWHGGWAVEAEQVEALLAATGLRRRPPREASAWGYTRVSARRSLLLCDTTPPPLPKDARFACASTLAFEFSHGMHRIVVNCGGAEAAGGLVPADLERGLRASAAHSTLTLGDSNSTAILPRGRIGGGVSTVNAEVEAIERDPAVPSSRDGTRILASHDGYVRRFGLLHHRELILTADGEMLLGEDRLEPAKKKGKRKKVAFAVRFHLGPDVQCYLVPEARGAQLVHPDGSTWEFRAPEGQLSIDDSVWVDGAGRPVATRQLVLSDSIGRTGGRYPWSLTLAR
jgi:uncharacterized heparinase superfamily protein